MAQEVTQDKEPEQGAGCNRPRENVKKSGLVGQNGNERKVRKSPQEKRPTTKTAKRGNGRRTEVPTLIGQKQRTPSEKKRRYDVYSVIHTDSEAENNKWGTQKNYKEQPRQPTPEKLPTGRPGS